MRRGNTTNRWLDRGLGIPFLLATSLFRKKRTLPRPIARIGILASPTIGDTLLTSAPLQDIKRVYPDSRLIYFAPQGSLPAIRLLPGVDEIAPIKITDPGATILTMRNAKVDLLLDFTPWQRLTAFYSAVSGAKCRVGFRSPGQYRHFHYDIAVDHSAAVHELENFRRLVCSVGISPMAEPCIDVAADLHTGFPPAGRVIVFHPWASGDRAVLRQWPAANWGDLAAALTNSDTLFVVTGAAWEQTKSLDLCRSLASRGLNALAFQSPDGLPSLAAMLKTSDLVVSVNTGILHLAAIVGAPTVALNGPTATHRWGPVGPRVASVEPRGGGGFLHFGFEFEGNPADTMQRIEVQDVVAAAARLLRAPVTAVSQTA